MPAHLVPRRPLVVAALALALLAGCRRQPQAPPSAAPIDASPRRGGTAVIAVGSDLQSVNPLLGNTQLIADVTSRALFLTLLEEQPDFTEHPPTFAPRLAERYEWSPDHRTLTFHLRSDVVWSDGVPVDAEDVAWTFAAEKDPDVAWGGSYTKEQIDRLEVVDPHTVRFHFTQAYLAQLADANEGVILPKHVWAALPFKQWRSGGVWFRDHLVVDGPFEVESWTPQQELVLRRNPRYFEAGQPRLDRVVVRVLPDPTTMVTQLLAGTVDYVEQLTPTSAAQVRAAAQARVLAYPSRQFTAIAWNTKRPLFADAAVRRALTLAIDRQELVDTIWRGAATVSSSPLISSVWAHDRTLAPWPYDPEQAKKILAERGWSDHDGDGIADRGGRKFSFELTYNAGNRIRADAAVLIQNQLRRAGIEARPRALDHNEMVAENEAHRFDSSIVAWTIDTSLDMSYAFSTEAIAEGTNFGSYSNPELDRLFATARLQTDPERAKAALVEAQRILHRDQPYTLLWEPQRLDGVAARLRDVQPNALSAYFNLRQWWIAEPAR